MAIGMKRLFLLFTVLLLLSSCLKTSEKLFTALEECKSKKSLDDPNEVRDPYDNCLLFTDEMLKTEEGCTKKCKDYCNETQQKYEDMWVDFTGCHCYCRLKL